MGRRFYTGVASALAGAVLWGFSGNCIQALTANAGLDPLAITCARALIAAAMLLAFCLVRYRAAIQGMFRDRRALRIVLTFGLALFLSQATYAISVEHTNAGTATVLQSLATVFVMLFACLSGRRLPRPLEAIGLGCAIASTWLIATQGNPAALSLPLAGIIWGLVNALSVAVYLICPRSLYEKWPSLAVIACGTCASALFATVAWLARAMANGGVALPALTAGDALLLIGGIGILGTACAFALYLHGVSIVGSVNGSLLGTAEPASAMLIMVAWLGTSVSAADWLGLILMVAMIAAVALSRPTQEDGL